MHANDNDEGPLGISTERARALAAAVLQTLDAVHGRPARAGVSTLVGSHHRR